MARVKLPSATEAPVIDIAAPLGPQKHGVYLVHIDEWLPPSDGNSGYLAKTTVNKGMLDFKVGPDGKPVLDGEGKPAPFFNPEYIGQSIWTYVNPPTDSDPVQFKKQLGAFKASLLAMGFPESFVHGGGSIDLDDPTEGGTQPGNAIVGRTMCLLYEPPLTGYVTQGKDGKTYPCKQRTLPVIPTRFNAFRAGEKPQYVNHLGNPGVIRASEAAGGGGFGGGGAAGFGKQGGGGGGFDPDTGSAAGGGGAAAATEPVKDPWAV